MNVHFLQHVPFEGLGALEPLLINLGHKITGSHLYLDAALPSVDQLDWLIILGGPMGVSQEKQYLWMQGEKRFIRKCLTKNKKVLGICLGAQLIAEQLGANVIKNPDSEIGWFPVLKNCGTDNSIINALPDNFMAFHWHGETFDIPPNATALGSSKACKNQGFVWGDRVVALQFHLESTLDSIQALLDNCSNELDASTYMQSKSEILNETSGLEQLQKILPLLVHALDSVEN